MQDAGVGQRRGKNSVTPYLECDVVVPDTDLQFLLPNDVFLWPVRVVFPLYMD